ncbi:rhomboid-domain-containing protein [Hypoxylon trugodes]|uniref:rhomboid-domain-containing protein n=1 Tax=Hypoxylon trugodes TaxID=326681 RepID=UPI0021A0EE83|nr:rhomboid-domain-containing protein [Hypoxylon trugodes]KAI1386878.1 rhomboid-domain-containing protein [Hypoxylon trugodes]
MPVFPSFAPPSSFRLGLRAITGNSGNSLISSAARSFSTRYHPTILCSHYSSRGAINRPRITTNYFPHIVSPRIPIRTFRFRAITEYVRLPDSYEDRKGLPFRKEDLSQRDVNKIFGAHLEAPEANRLLRVLHGRRVAGTLEDPSLKVNTTYFSNADQEKALKYLRDNIPVDEVINAGLRAEDELKYLEAQEKGDDKPEEQFEETGHQDPPSDEVVEKVEVPTGRLPMPKSDSPYGVGSFDRIRAENIAKREAEEKRLEAERIDREREEALGNIGTLQTIEQKPRELSPRMKKWRERGTSDLKEFPNMKPWERLLPSLAMTLLVLGGCVAYATMYTAPKKSGRIWPDIPPAAATCLALIGINLTIWCLWRAPPVWPILNRYFILVAATPRPLQLIGAMFSHHHFNHVALNMVALWFFGTRLHDEVGRGNFLAIYLTSGVLGFMTSLANLVLIRGLEFTTLGASGGIYGIVGAFFWLHRYDEFKLFGYPPDPMSGPQGLAFLGLILGMHIVPLLSRSKKMNNLDIASHIGGMVAGVASADLVKRHMDHKARLRAEKLKTMGALEKVVLIKDKDPQKTARLPAGR